MKRSSVGAVVVTVGLLASCEGTDNVTKRQIGTVGGAVLGGVAGALLGDGAGRVVAAAVGAAAGALIGNLVGGVLDEQDRAAVEQQAAAALDSAGDGESVEWSNSDTGASATLTPRDTQVVEKEVVVLRDERIVETPTLELIGKPYQAKSDADVRGGPSADAAIVASLAETERFNVVGRVENANWYLISRDARSIGYVHGDLIGPSSTSGSEVQLREPIDLDAIKLDDDVVVDTVPVRTECRTMDLHVTARDGQTEDNSFEACKAPDGAWEI